MVNKEILGGLKTALEKGESLKRAMTTLFNAGYKKEEIEEAARALSEPLGERAIQLLNNKEVSQAKKPGLFKKLISPREKPIQKIPSSKEVSSQIPVSPQIIQQTSGKVQAGMQPSSQPQIVQPVIIQRVSGYEEQVPREKIIIAVLITLLVVLLGVLAAIFLFQQQLINFFSSIFNQQT